MDYSVIAERIRSARMGVGLSQEELAVRLGVHRSTLVRWEGGKGATPTIANLHEMAEALQVSLELLAVGRDDVQQPSACLPVPRRDLENRLLQLSRHVPVSFLTTVISMLESATSCLE